MEPAPLASYLQRGLDPESAPPEGSIHQDGYAVLAIVYIRESEARVVPRERSGARTAGPTHSAHRTAISVAA
jgi:hypothetical protein